MTVTIKNKSNHVQVALSQKEKDLYWTNSLRQLIPPTGDEDKWKCLSPAACKLYLLIWALDSSQWKLTEDNKKYNGVHLYGLVLYSGMKSKILFNSLYELVNSGLISENPTNASKYLSGNYINIKVDLPASSWQIKATELSEDFSNLITNPKEQPTFKILYELSPDVIENGI